MYFSEGEKTWGSFVNYIVCAIFANIFGENNFIYNQKTKI